MKYDKTVSHVFAVDISFSECWQNCDQFDIYFNSVFGKKLQKV